jgi:hypothetical protein
MDLDRDARRILDLASDAHAPAAEDKARMERKLAAVLGGSVLAITGTAATGTATAGAAATAPAASGGASTAVSGARAASSAALKWWISAGVVAAAVTGYIGLSSPTPAPAAKPRAPTPLVVAPPPAPARVESLPANVPASVPTPAVPTARNHTPRKQAAATLSEEIELLHRAQTAWRAREAGAALRLLDEHRSRFPRTQLRLERDGLRVLTLCELGQKAQATALAKKLLEQAPRSPLRTTIEESCALK